MGEIRLRAAEIDPELYVYGDEADGAPRFTYVWLYGLIVKAYAVMIATDPVQDLPCFRASVVVPTAFRGKGHAKGVLQAAMAELKNGLSRNNVSSFYVEAIVNADDVAGQRVAEAVLSATPLAVKDPVSGLPALRYLRKL